MQVVVFRIRIHLQPLRELFEVKVRKPLRRHRVVEGREGMVMGVVWYFLVPSEPTDKEDLTSSTLFIEL